MALELNDILAMRVISEEARMADVGQLLPVATHGATDLIRDRFRTRIDQRLRWAGGLVASTDGWQSFTDGAADADLLVDELVSRSVTQLLRDNGLDSGAFDVGERLAAEIVDRAGLPDLVLGHTPLMESLDHTRATVAMRFPGSRIWDVPILAHEVGHHATRELPHIEPALRSKRPLAELSSEVAKALADEGIRPDRIESHADELLADCVATVACGATYPIACLILRVPRAGAAAIASKSHPSWVTRIAVIRQVLEALSVETGKARYRQQLHEVLDPIAAAVLDHVPDPSPAGADAAVKTATLLLTHCPQLLYDAADTAIEIAEQLSKRAAAAPPGATIRSVLDGAWRWRLRRAARRDDAAVAALAVDYCRQVERR